MLKNVVEVCDYAYVEGGASNVTIKTALFLSEKYKVYFFAGVGQVCDELKNSNVTTICLNQKDLLGNPNRIKAALNAINNKIAAKKMSELLSSLNPSETIIHVQSYTKCLSSSVIPVALKKGFKVVFTIHDYFLICPNGALYNYKKSKACHLKPLSFKCIMCNCDSRNYLQKLFRVVRQFKQNKNIIKHDNISYIFISDFSHKQFAKRYPNIDTRNLYHLDNMIDFPKERKRSICEQNSSYLFVGRVCAEKDIHTFCEGIKLSGASGVVIGDGPLLNEYKNKYNMIDFKGWCNRKEITENLLKARAFVFSSVLYEVSPLSTLESLSLGVPVICANSNAGTSHIIDKETGLLFESQNAVDLANKIKMTFDDSFIKTLSICAFEKFDENRYSQSTFVQTISNIFEDVMRGQMRDCKREK